MWLDSVEQRPPLYNLQHFQKSEEGGGGGVEERETQKKQGEVGKIGTGQVWMKQRQKSGLYSNSFTTSFHLFVAAKRSPVADTPLQDHTVPRACTPYIIFSRFACAPFLPLFTLTPSVLTS